MGNFHEFGVELHQFNCQNFMNNKDYSRASKLVMLAAALLDFSKKGFATLMPGPLGVILAFVLWVNSWLNSGREFEAHQRNLSFF